MTDSANPPAVNIVNEAAVDESPPSIDQMKQAIRDSRDRLARELASERKNRDRVNARIRKLVAEHAEAERLVKALEPRKAKK